MEFDIVPEEILQKHEITNNQPTVLLTLQQNMVDRALWVILALSAVMEVMINVEEFQRGRYGVVAVYVIFYLLMLFIAVRKSLPHLVRAMSVPAILYLVAVSELWLYSIVSNAPLYLFAFVILTGIFTGFRSGLVAFGVSIITLTAFGWVYISGILPKEPIPEHLYLNRPELARGLINWVSMGLPFVFVSASILVCLMSMFRVLVEKTEEAETLLRELELENEERHVAMQEREVAIEASLESEKRLREAQSVAHIGSFESWGDGTGIWWSDELYTIFGLDPDTFVPTRDGFIELLHPDDHYTYIKTLKNIIETGETTVMQYRAKHGNGEWKHYEAVVTRSEGGIAGLRGTVQDITDSKRIHAALSKSESRFRTVLENSNDLLYQFNLETETYDYLSPSIETLCGFSAEHYLKGGIESMLPLIPPEEREALKDHLLLRELGDDFMPTLEYRFRHPRLGYRWFSDKRTIIYDKHNNPISIVGNIRDITESKENEEHERELEEQLRQSHKMEAIGQLAGGIAHDFNNILQSMLGYCELANKQGLDDDKLMQSCLSEIKVGGQRAADLVNQLLTFSRVEEMHRTPVLLGPIAHEAIKFLRSSLPSSIEMTENIEDGFNLVLADETQIHQIVLNLCTNASHAIGDDVGKIEIVMKNETVEKARSVTTGNLAVGNYVMLSVKDSGSGIEANNLERIFDPFYTTKEVGAGTGLGLSTIHGIVTSMNGAIHVETKLGEGSEFKVYFSQYEAIVDKRKSTPAESVPNRKMSGHVLFVDDEESITKLFEIALVAQGFTVDAFTDASDALNAFQENPLGFSIVVSDLTMPGMTGSILAKEIRSINTSIPIVLASGQISKDFAMPEEVSEMLSKPFDIDKLVEVIERHVAPVV